jgi:hypothetical protein
MTNVRSGLFLSTGLTVFLLLTACGEGDSPDLFARRVDASFEVTAKVTYEVAFDPYGTGEANPMSLSITQGRWGRRTDSYTSREDKTYSGTLLDLGDEQYICNRYSGLGPEDLEGLTLTEDQIEAWEDGVCISSELSLDESDDEGLGGFFDFMFSFRETLKEHDEEVEWEATSSRTIAGINADCYHVTFTDPETGQSDDADICFSDDNILLSMDLPSPDATGILAQEVDRDVQEGDFALPYPVADWPY